MKKAKVWTITYLLVLLIFLSLFMTANYRVDANNYFLAGRGGDFVMLTSTGVLKGNALAHSDVAYDAYIVGGSKAGTVDVALLDEKTGLRWYDLTLSNGTFEEYETYIRYLVNERHAERIVLYLSGHEVARGVPENDISAYADGTPLDILEEKVRYLTLDVDTMREYLDNRQSYENYSHIYGDDGTYDYRYYKSHCTPLPTKEYIEEHVIKNWNDVLDGYFKSEIDLSVAQSNIAHLKEIKDICQKGGAELTVLMGPKFIGETLFYECPEYYSYLREMVAVTPVMDFSTICPINMNPYNFINPNHCNYALNHLVTAIMIGIDERTDYGVLLTDENIEVYIRERTEEFTRLQREFETTGSVACEDLEADSFIDDTEPND